jgi:NitT/TauT family transport system substrate-binding protein
MRRSAVIANATSLLGLAVLRCPARAQSTLPHVRVGTINTTDSSASPIYGVETGAFRREGLDVETIALPTGGAVLAAIAGGSLEIGFSNPLTAATAVAHGLPLVILAPAMLYTPKATPSFMCRARGGSVRSGADLLGKTVAVQSLNGELHLHAMFWIDQHGGDAKSVKFLEMPPGAMVAALKDGKIEAATIGEPDFTEHKADIEAFGDAYGGLMPKGIGIGGVYVGSKPWVQANLDATKHFLRGLVATARWANSHHAETAKILATRANISPETVNTMTRIIYGDSLDPTLVQPLYDVAYKYGFIKEPANASALFSDAAVLWREAKLA